MKTIPAELKVPDEGLAAARLIFLHVAPGIVIMADFVLNASLTASLGWQATLALFIAWLVIGLPLLLGLHFYRGRKPNGRWSLKGVVIYRQPLPVHQYALLVPILLIWTAVWSTVLFPLADAVRGILFAWWPGWLNLSAFIQSPTRYPLRSFGR